MITLAGATFQTDKVFVGVLIFAITGMLATEIVDRAERKNRQMAAKGWCRIVSLCQSRPNVSQILSE